MSQVCFTSLTPLAFLERSADVFPDKSAIVHGERRITYREFAAQATRLARALQASGVVAGDRVAYLAPNIPELLVAHFAVPLAGAVLVAINTRLSPDEVRYICDDSGAVLLVADTELLEPLDLVLDSLTSVREVVAIQDAQDFAPPELGAQRAVSSYAELLARGSDEVLPWTVADEGATISINYTSGTTGQPKGVMYSHRGAYLNALGEIIHSEYRPESVYLWTLPMFHCNGWCTTWAVTAIGATHVCLRAVRGDAIWQLLDQERVTHLNGAPTVLVTIAGAPQAHALDHPLIVTVAGAPPSPTIIARMSELGARTVHVYGLTETYGPYSVNEWQQSWADLPADQRARQQARQGVHMVQAERLRVVDELMVDVPQDGETMGEIVMRGNNVMQGYYNDPEATAAAFRGGWFHSGDLGVTHPDGYVELRDRAKDIVISGGENISTVEVAHLARYKTPSAVEFIIALPKTSTGKIQKFELRDKEWAGHTSRIKG